MVLQRLRQKIDDLYDQFYDILEKTDFSIPTFLAFGAVFQLLSIAYLPPTLSTSLPLLWLGWRLARSTLASRDVFRTSFTDVVRGVHTTKLPESSDGVVVFILGARLNHPFGKLAPGTTPLDVVFKDMWREAEKNREKYGYLGRTATLADTSDNEGTTTVWISYWRDLKGLHAFARSGTHMLGQKNWIAGKYPYVGVMHETYHAPKGHHEELYGNYRRWGLGAVKVISDEKDTNGTFVDALVPNKRGSTMYSRMGRKDVS